jgi:hypothetical protein
VEPRRGHQGAAPRVQRKVGADMAVEIIGVEVKCPECDWTLKVPALAKDGVVNDPAIRITHADPHVVEAAD